MRRTVPDSAQFISNYDSPLGRMTVAGTETELTGLWFDGQKYFAGTLGGQEVIPVQKETDVIIQTKMWLDIYFSGREPAFMPPVKMLCSEFRKRVWDILLSIPYGQTTTYGTIAKKIARENGLRSMSAQAVGGAAGHNSISIIIPCHRILGADGSLTGYAGGTDKKLWLLEHEGAVLNSYVKTAPEQS